VVPLVPFCDRSAYLLVPLLIASTLLGLTACHKKVEDRLADDVAAIDKVLAEDQHHRQLAAKGLRDATAQELASEYNIVVKTTGGRYYARRCQQAELVAAAYLHAKNQAEYQKWLDIAHADCMKAT
jgi:hypothetical protein